MVESDGLWYIYGGADADVQTFDPKSSTFGKLATSNTPAARTGHSAVAYKRAMYVLGGLKADGSLCSALRRLDVDTGVWSELPSPLGGIVEHTALVKDGLMWVFGGRDEAGAALGALWTFDLESELWAESDTAADDVSSPAPRFGHSAALVGDEMLVFGGETASGALVNDVWAVHVDARERALPTWQRAAVVDGAVAPVARAHAVVVVHDNALWVFGGRDSTQTLLDVWALDLEYLQWELIACLPGAAFPQCREAAIKMSPAADEALTSFRFVSPGVSEATYTVSLHSPPTHSVTVVPDVDAGHVQLSPAELTFDESNWNQPQTVRVLVLEDLFLPGDASELTITHATRTADVHYKRSVLAARPVTLPSICGDGRCLGDENYVNCAADCRNYGAAPFCGDGLCAEETYQSCPDDCSVQGSDNSCPRETPVRCRSGECAAAAGACATRARTSAQACGVDQMCQGVVLACGNDVTGAATATASDDDDDDDDDDDTVLCADGSCARTINHCPLLPPCGAGLKRCFDTSCQAACGSDTLRCPPARPNLNLIDMFCRGEPLAGEVPIESAQRDYATLTTVHRPVDSTSRVWLLAANAQQYYGQLAFPGGALDGTRDATCPCSDEPSTPDVNDPMVGVRVVVLADGALPNNSFAGFNLTLPSGESGSFSPHVAQVWVSTMRTNLTAYCLGAWNAATRSWWCVDESLDVSSLNATCDCELKHVRGSFGFNYGSFAFIPDNW
jgi:hypothetical protein